MKGINLTDFLGSTIYSNSNGEPGYHISYTTLITFCRIIECTLDHSCPNFFFLDFVGGYFFKRNTLKEKKRFMLDEMLY